ncbi:Polypyrimidine tract-binding protein like 3 [Dendrobium catenatum]|uniref:Polypyrimidine tract-binding protein like 3 n=1 Tax=Dendrobium catenatum TaxID=906689 RepID=A0A2I0VKC5_9ASPA|nr:Polypyrimidine tract-binding protein like 3 [Dendrobium catenatum]
MRTRWSRALFHPERMMRTSDSGEFTRGGMEPNRILLVTVHSMLHPITVEVLHQVFSPYGIQTWVQRLIQNFLDIAIVIGYLNYPMMGKHPMIMVGSAYGLVDLWFAGSIGPWLVVVLGLAVLEHSVLSLFSKLLELKFSSSLILKRYLIMKFTFGVALSLPLPLFFLSLGKPWPALNGG